MKKNYFLQTAILSVALLFGAVPSFGAVDMLQNGSFEDWSGDAPTAWDGNSTNIAASGVSKSTDARTGSNALVLTVTNDSHKRYSTQAYRLKPGIEYSFSFWAKGQGDVRNAYYNTETQKYSTYSGYTPINSTEWTQVTYTFSLDAEKGEAEGDYELVDFYTALNNAEQEKILKSIPALQNAVITSFGKIYLRTHLKSSACIDRFLKIKNHENIFVGGGFLGVGGVYENLLVANYIAHNIMRELNRKNLFESPKNTALGLLVEKLLKKSCLNDMLLSLNYDIIGKDELNFDSGEILKFKENCHGKFLQN